ncbi:hypothetical protein CRENBAI_011261 [Crenichthys baileyi]|uniref:Uncharacterized protein n=1 Tax=Crenichthys baileyi TaxID=28760 RepID=A0AAV9SEB2_9TELE
MDLHSPVGQRKEKFMKEVSGMRRPEISTLPIEGSTADGQIIFSPFAKEARGRRLTALPEVNCGRAVTSNFPYPPSHSQPRRKAPQNAAGARGNPEGDRCSSFLHQPVHYKREDCQFHLQLPPVTMSLSLCSWAEQGCPRMSGNGGGRPTNVFIVAPPTTLSRLAHCEGATCTPDPGDTTAYKD